MGFQDPARKEITAGADTLSAVRMRSLGRRLESPSDEPSVAIRLLVPRTRFDAPTASMAEIIRCPHCMTTVYEDAQYCHSCSGRLKRRSRRIFTKGAVTFILVGVAIFGTLDALDLLLNRRSIQRNHTYALERLVTSFASDKVDRVKGCLNVLLPDDFEDAICGAEPIVQAKKKGYRITSSVKDLGPDPLPFENNARRYLLTVTVAKSALSFNTYIADAWFRNSRREHTPLAFRWRDSRDFDNDIQQAAHR